MPALRDGFPDCAKRYIAPVSTEAAACYFDHLQAHGIPTGPLAANLRCGTAGSLAILIKRPLYLDLARSALAEGQVTPSALMAAPATAEGARALEDSLIGWNLRHRLLLVRSGGRRKAQHLVYLAEQMTKHKAVALPWWQLADCVRADVMIASVLVLAAAPSTS